MLHFALMAGLLLLCSVTHAAEVTAASPALPDIQVAVESLDGPGTVRVPAGEAEAVGTLKVPAGVSIIGAGAEHTKLFRGAQTEIHKSGNIIHVTGGEGAADTLTQIAGLNLIGETHPDSKAQDAGIRLDNVPRFRVDHCRLESFGNAAVMVRGNTSGVVDHCQTVDVFRPAINNLGYGVAVYGSGVWREDLEPGGAGAVFIEDCELIGSRHAVASNNGAWYVFRHNHIHQNAKTQAVDAHGHGYGSKVGTQYVEVYENVIEKPRQDAPAMLFRGGGGVVFNNTVRDHSSAIGLTLDYDSSIDWSAPYPIDFQVRDFWVWDNTLNGEPVEPFVPSRSAGHIQLGRDYHTEPKPGYTPYTYPHPLASGGPFDEE